MHHLSGSGIHCYFCDVWHAEKTNSREVGILHFLARPDFDFLKPPGQELPTGVCSALVAAGWPRAFCLLKITICYFTAFENGAK